jgi:hypothetical protein
MLKLFTLLAVASFYLMSAAVAQQPVQLRGYVVAKTVDCFNPKNHHHEPLYFLEDDVTGERVPLKGYDKQLQAIDPRQKVSIRGVRRNKAADAAPGQKSAQPQQDAVVGSEGDVEIQHFEVQPITEEAEMQEPLPENGANSLTMLSTLLVFISTDTHACMTSETNARNRLFNNATNANLGMQAITKGRYGLQLGNGTGVPDDHTIDLLLNVNSASHDTGSIETLALNKLFGSLASGGMGFNRLAWNRILLFAPGGITDSTFTAYAYYPWGSYTTSGLVSMYGNSYGNNRMNGYLHELGHNFGFAHSSKGTSEYGDRTCVMGSSNDGTRTETYNAAKLLETNWLDAFTNAKVAVSTDITLDLYPLSSDPNVGTIAVSFPGTDYYAAYHRNQEPYGFLSQTGDRDRVFVYTRASGSTQKSFQVANIAAGASYTGPGVVRFERYGPNNTYATVSFDMNDGNTKPVANAQSISATINTAKAITLTGSDANSDALTYTKVTDPANGVLSGTVPNLTYTPINNYLGADSFVFKVHDGKISSFATVTITVNALPAIYASWAGGSFANPFNALDPAGNQDGDQHSNLMEFAFGTDPTLQDATSLATNGSVNGSPVPRDAGGGVFEYCFMRRKDHGTSGSVSYTVQFSNNLSDFTNSVVAPTFVANSNVNANYEVVKVPFPAEFRFGRVGVEIVP